MIKEQLLNFSKKPNHFLDLWDVFNRELQEKYMLSGWKLSRIEILVDQILSMYIKGSLKLKNTEIEIVYGLIEQIEYINDKNQDGILKLETQIKNFLNKHLKKGI